MSDTDLESSQSVAAGKKRGRPARHTDIEWIDEDVYILVNLWSKHGCLFNSKDPHYANKNSRTKALDQIVESLIAEGIQVTSKQVQEKLTKLRNYYGAERRRKVVK